ncbi:hypothetical protein [Nonlabens sp. Asnod3-A02]|uniref:hypothetical protein n=1 Tax=Nonlabens sp. Asnod3-A02 TaxID=3160579 RepID=UPI00386B2717
MKFKKILLLFIIVSIPSFVFSQVYNKTYYGVVSDSLFKRHMITFKNDSIVELSSIPCHFIFNDSKKNIKSTFNYHKRNDSISILKNDLDKDEIKKINELGYSQFLNNLTLNIDKKAIVDNKNQVVYVLLSDFPETYNSTFIIDQEIFIIKNGTSNLYGMISSLTESNDQLEVKFDAAIKDVIDGKKTLNSINGIEAFYKYGYNYVLGGVTVISSNNESLIYKFKKETTKGRIFSKTRWKYVDLDSLILKNNGDFLKTKEMIYHDFSFHQLKGTWEIKNDTLSLKAKYINKGKLETNWYKTDLILQYKVKKHKLKPIDKEGFFTGEKLKLIKS